MICNFIIIIIICNFIGLAGVKNENGEKEKHIKAYKQQLEDAIRKQRDFHIAASAAGVS